MVLAGVFVAGPEEAFESVAFAPRHYVDVQVRYALADSVVDGYEAAFGIHGGYHGALDCLCGGEERGEFVGWNVGKCFDVTRGDEEYMSGEERPVVEEGECVFASPDDFGWDVARGDVTEDARHGILQELKAVVYPRIRPNAIRPAGCQPNAT